MQKSINVAKTFVTLFSLGMLVWLLGACDVEESLNAEEANDRPAKIDVGQAFTHDKYDVAAGWKVKSDGIGGATLKGLRVTNKSDSPDTPMLTFDFNKGKQLLFTIECTGNELQAGATGHMSCFSTGNLRKGYKTVTVRDMW